MTRCEAPQLHMDTFQTAATYKSYAGIKSMALPRLTLPSYLCITYPYVDLRTSVWWYYFTKICFNLTFLSYICNKCKILSSSRPHLIPLSRLEQWKLVVFGEFSFAQWAKWWLKCNRFLAKWISQILSNIVYKSIPEKEKIWMSMQKNLWDM